MLEKKAQVEGAWAGASGGRLPRNCAGRQAMRPPAAPPAPGALRHAQAPRCALAHTTAARAEAERCTPCSSQRVMSRVRHLSMMHQKVTHSCFPPPPSLQDPQQVLRQRLLSPPL